MCRSNWKGNFIEKSILKKAEKDIRIWCRHSVVPSNFVGLSVFIHNGKEFKKILITREKVGFKFGDFVLTRKHVFKQKLNKTQILKKSKK